MSRAAVIADVIRTQGRQLKMPGVTRAFEDLARQAREEHWTHEDYLHEVLSVEIASRAESAVKQRLRTAAFPEMKTLDQFDFGAAEGLSAPKVAELARCEWVAQAENVLLAGPIGTGKTHLAIALGIEAARQRRRVAFWGAPPTSCAPSSRPATPKNSDATSGASTAWTCSSSTRSVSYRSSGTVASCSSTCSPPGTGRRSVVITTNLAFAEWPKVFGSDEKLTTALLDRLAERATVITTKGKSYRMRKRAINNEPTAQSSPPEPVKPTKEAKTR